MARRVQAGSRQVGPAMNTDSAQLKAQLRARLVARAGQTTPDQRAASSRTLCHALQQLPLWPQAGVVLFFAPLPTEPDIWPALKWALAQGKVVGLPRHCPAEDTYRPYRIVDADRDVRPGRFGIREPAEHCVPLAPEQIELVLVPGIGFGLNGGRLGRGKGYYDRLLAKVPGIKCGVAFEWQIEPEIPLEPHDVAMDWLVSPAGLVEVNRRQDGGTL